MFSQEQEAAFQKEMDAIVAEEAQNASTEGAQPHETAEAEIESTENTDAEATETEENDTDPDVSEEDETEDETSKKSSKPEAETNSEDADTNDEDDDELDDEDDSDEDDEDEEDQQQVVKKAQTKEVRKSIARIQRKHEVELADRDARIARLEEQFARNNATPSSSTPAAPLDEEAQIKKRIDAMVARGYSSEFAAQTVAYEMEQQQERSRTEAENQAAQARKKMEDAFKNAVSKIEKAVIADPELKQLGQSYRGVKMTQPMQMALGQVDRPGRVLKHILKKEPKFIEALANRSPEEQYAQLLILSGRLDAQREFQKQNKAKTNPKPPPTGKVSSRGQKVESNDPMTWSSAKLHREMGLS